MSHMYQLPVAQGIDLYRSAVVAFVQAGLADDVHAVREHNLQLSLMSGPDGPTNPIMEAAHDQARRIVHGSVVVW